MMNALPFFGGVSFLSPLVLLGLTTLPVIYFLLRVTPPPPVHVAFPAIRFLEGLHAKTIAPSRTPWWILLLRLFIAALVIIALARPVLNRQDSLLNPIAAKEDVVRIVLDNGWESAQIWDEILDQAQLLIAQAQRVGRPVMIMGTAFDAPQDQLESPSLLDAKAAAMVLKTMHPYPWPADYRAVQNLIKEEGERDQNANIETFFLSAGLDGRGVQGMMRLLSAQGTLTLVKPEKDSLPVVLSAQTQRRGQNIIQKLDVHVPRYGAPAPEGYIVQAETEKGQVLDIVAVRADDFDSATYKMSTQIEHTPEIAQQVARYRIAGRRGSGSLWLSGGYEKQALIGVVGRLEQIQTAPLNNPSYYIARAFEPFGQVRVDTLEALLSLEEKPDIIALPDVGAMPLETLDDLSSWVAGGGLLLRFGGPNLAKTGQENALLLPVPIRHGGRAFEGSLSWDQAKHLAPFSPDSPFAGLEFDPQVTVKRQILADPSTPDLDEHIWARLEDGTPIITANDFDKGLMILIHTSADAAWSNLPLSGLFVKMIKKISTMGGQSFSDLSKADAAHFDPLWVLDGFGTRGGALKNVLPVELASSTMIAPSYIHPPGLYAAGSQPFFLNMGAHLEIPQALIAWPSGVQKGAYGTAQEKNLMPLLLLCAFTLFLADWIFTLWISGISTRLRVFWGAKKAHRHARGLSALLLCVMLFAPVAAQAQNRAQAEAEFLARKHATGLYLAYIKTGDPKVDKTSTLGLENLSEVLRMRTSVEPDGVVALNPEHDELALMEIHGIAQEELKSFIGHPWVNLYTDKGKQVVKDQVLPELVMHGYWRGDSPIMRRDGSVLHTEMSLTELPDGGFIGTARDVSDRIRNEEEKRTLEEQFLQAQKMEAVGRLAGGIAHDFNNILAAMSGYTEFLIEDLEEGTPQHDFAVKLLSAGRQARDLVDQMLAFSRRKESSRTEIDLISPIDETVSMLNASLPKSIDLSVDLNVPEAPVNANATQISQILMNLCVNAKDALEDDHGRLNIALDLIHAGQAENFEHDILSRDLPEPSANPVTRIQDLEPGRTRLTLGTLSTQHNYFRLSVRDSGSGMSRIIMEHIFEPFFTTKPVDKGTGLGLATVHGAILAHQGFLVIDSTLGSGTRFEIYLPANREIVLPKTTDRAKQKETTSTLLQETTLQNKKILLVEDQKEVSEMMISMLERLGCTAELCETGLEALDLLREKPTYFDLVLTDHNMPKMTGLELVQQTAIDFPDLPFVLLSGYSENKLKGLMKEHSSIKQILHKPISKSILEQKILAVLQEQNKQKAA
jgi:signal transduction histidine kinase/ActR/RegA family two-component response regulator